MNASVSPFLFERVEGDGFDESEAAKIVKNPA
jgi:hypothetical protein